MLIGSIGLSTSLTINDVHTRGTLPFRDERSLHLLCALLRGDCFESADALRHWTMTYISKTKCSGAHTVQHILHLYRESHYGGTVHKFHVILHSLRQ